LDSRTKWNSKYIDRILEEKNPIPNQRLKMLAAYLKGGTALDLACGLGGNSLFLAERNYQVQAIDISDVAISYLQKQAAQHHLNIEAQVRDLTDLKQLSLPEGSFDVVVITYYLDRSVFPFIKHILKEGGYFFMETFYQSPLKDNLDVSNQYKLESRELLREFADWHIIHFEENDQEGWQTIFCRNGKI
jgi:tellurite methyltransferase